MSETEPRQAAGAGDMRVTVTPSPTADTRTCNVSTVSLQHIGGVAYASNGRLKWCTETAIYPSPKA